MARRPLIVLRTPEAVRAVGSPLAHQVVSVMERLRRASVTELGEHLGVAPSSLYYHVRRLVSVGVLVADEERATGGRSEVVYALAGREVVLDPEGREPRFLAALARAVRTRLRAVERAFVAALSDPRGRRAGRGRNLSLHQHHARLSPADRAELYRRIEALEEFLFERDDPARTDFTHVTLAVLPVLREPDT